MEDRVLEGLNSQQSEAVTHAEGPLLIIAGAGTGKTAVITRRIAYLIASQKAKQEEILALTFTDKAAAEMEERVDILLPYGYTDIWISTFHAFGDRILRENALELGLDPEFQVLTRPESIIFFREHLFEFPLSYFRPLSEPTRYIEAMVNLFSRAKDEDISPEEYLEYAKKLKEKSLANPKDEELKETSAREMEIGQCYAKYQELLDRFGKVDFGNQFYLTLKLFRSHPAILKRYQEQFKYILVDEFQDTNYAQFQLVKLLGTKYKNITVVADDDQCLPPNALIDTIQGKKKIKDIKRGDIVITAVGKGHTGMSKVVKVLRRKRKARFLTFITEKGYKLTVTSNHKMFCFVPVRWTHEKEIFYVYLMWRKGLGWRLGTTDNLAVRLKIERSADKIIGLRAFKTEQEAQYFESLLAFKYGIPTNCFMKRRGLHIVDNLLKRLYAELDTEERVKKLAQDLDIDLRFHHYCLGAVTRGNKVRIKINLNFCYRRYVSKEGKNRLLINPSIIYMVSLETSDNKVIYKLKRAGIPLKKAKKGMCVRFSTVDLKKAEDLANHLQKITAGILEYKFALGKLRTQHKPALVMPASNVLVGHYLPIRVGNRIIYDKIKDIKEEIKTEDTYDLQIDRTHNFIADGVVVHNCIYRFRGAAYSNMLNFMDVYPDAKKITLIQNYRSPQVILDTAYRLIQFNNPDRFEVKSNINKRLIGLTTEGEPVKYLRFDTVSSEADGVAKLIDEKVKSCQYSYQDFAILVRANNDADPFLRALNMRGIPWRFTGNQGLYNRDEIRLIIAFLRTITNLLDSISLFHLASSEIYNLKMLDLTRCSNFATRKNRPLFDVFKDLARIPELEDLSTKEQATIAKLVKDIEKFTEVSRLETTGRVLYRFLTETGYISRLSKAETKEADEKIQNIAKFFELVKNFQTIALQDRPIQFVSHLDMLIRAGDDPATVEADIDIPAVNILTIHKAKGLEFSVVFLVSLVMGRFPWPRRRESIELPDELIKDILPSGDFHIEEERRLFYVGMTRAKKELYFTSARDYGGNRLRKMSQFVYEALELSKEEETVYKASSLEAIERHAPPAKQELDLTYPIPDEQILTLSYFQVDDYLTCPLKYKYVHILRVPILQHHTVVYGKALHDAVEHYHRCKVKGTSVEIDDLISVFESSWRSEGFLSREHEEQRLESGRQALRRFFETEERKKIIPTYVEKDFSVVLGNDRLIGRWDRIDIIDNEVSIIDFKSSEIRKQKDADKRTKVSLQLSIYALAYQKMFGRIPDRVELHFLESALIGIDKKTEDDLQKTIENIKEASKGIRSRNFNAQPEYLACRYCAYNQICPYTTSKG